MPVIPVSDFMPDQAALGNKGTILIKNAVPAATSYKPFPSFVALTNALDARAQGAIDARDKDGDVYQYAGDASKLYQLTSTTWGDVSLSGGYSTGTDERWEFVRWKNQVLAVNWNNNPQYIEMGASNFADLTTAFKARRIARVRDFVVVGNTFDSTDGNKPDRVRWSAFNDETDWTVSPSTGSDYQDLKGSAIQRVFGGEHGIVLTEDSTYRMDFSGAPTWFTINETLPGIGSIAPGASARLGRVVYSWTSQGFVAIIDGTGFEWIGAGKVDDFALQDLDDEYLYRITCVTDSQSGRVFWSYPGAGSSAGGPNKILCFDPSFGKWSIIEEEVGMLWKAGGVGFTIDGLDSVSSSIDDLSVSLDSSVWKGGGAQVLAAFDENHKHGFFNGSPMNAVLETKEVEILPGRRAMLNAFRPLVSGAVDLLFARVGTRNLQTEDVTFGDSLTVTTSGRFVTRSNARYHRFRLGVSGTWEDIIGIQVDQEDVKPAGRR